MKETYFTQRVIIQWCRERNAEHILRTQWFVNEEIASAHLIKLEMSTMVLQRKHFSPSRSHARFLSAVWYKVSFLFEKISVTSCSAGKTVLEKNNKKDLNYTSRESASLLPWEEERKLNSLFAYDREASKLLSSQQNLLFFSRWFCNSLPGECHLVKLIQFSILNLFQKGKKPGWARDRIKPPLMPNRAVSREGRKIFISQKKSFQLTKCDWTRIEQQSCK